jgi:hypothetical protein
MSWWPGAWITWRCALLCDSEAISPRAARPRSTCGHVTFNHRAPPPRGGRTQQLQVANCLIMCRPTSIEAAEAWMAANKVCAPPQRPTGDRGECGGACESSMTAGGRAWKEECQGQRKSRSEASARLLTTVDAYCVRCCSRAGKGQSPHCRPGCAGALDGMSARACVCLALPSFALLAQTTIS